MISMIMTCFCNSNITPFSLSQNIVATSICGVVLVGQQKSAINELKYIIDTP